MKLINGRSIAASILLELKKKVAGTFRVPGLAIILVGDDPASHTYVSLKEKAAQDVGIRFEKFIFPSPVDQKTLIEKINELNAREDIHGIVVQLPLPDHLDADAIIGAIAAEKDVDGFHQENIRLLLSGKVRFIPGLLRGILRLIGETGVQLSDKRAVIIANSATFSTPLAYLLDQRGMRVDVLLQPDTDLREVLQGASLIIVAVGRPQFITGDLVRDGAVVIDVGFSRGSDGKIHGDVDASTLTNKAGWLTPVPGGVGPMTVVMLLSNVVQACNLQTS